MAKAAPKKAAPKKAAPKKAPAKPAVDRFESDWDGVPNFKLKDAKNQKK